MSYTARLRARPANVIAAAPTGLHSLNWGVHRNSLLYVPCQYTSAQPLPLVVLLHGAGGHAHHGLELMHHLADDNGMILLAPSSSGRTWDAIITSVYGKDVELIDLTLDHVFNRYAVDASHLAIGGFSDGASYALSLGLANGDLFTHVIAFSPGFIAALVPRDQPKIFISHGERDAVLPIDACSRRIVPRLQRAGYEVEYREFDGPHVIPPEIARDAVAWFLQAA